MSSSTVSLRPFGHDRDLDVPFDGIDRPFLVTAILAQCSEPTSADAWWAAPVGVRIAALLQLVALTERRPNLDATVRCPVQACRSTFEVALPVEAIVAAAAPFDHVEVALPDGRSVSVRPATGDDERRWNAAHYPTVRDAMAAIADALIVGGRVPDDDPATMDAIAAALADRDPLVHFTASCVCPVCAEPSDVAIDLEQLALERLAGIRNALLDDVHALASSYGWSERDILALTEERRARYRALIDGRAA